MLINAFALKIPALIFLKHRNSLRLLKISSIKYLVLLLFLLLFITFMQGIYYYIPETNYISMVYTVAAVLYSQFMLHLMLFRP